MYHSHRSQTSASTSSARWLLRSAQLALGFGLLFAFASGCGDDDDDTGKVCNVGDTRECVGPGACHGAQACLADGSGFKSCECGDTAGPGGSSGDAGGQSPAHAGDGGNVNTGGTGNAGGANVAGSGEQPGSAGNGGNAASGEGGAGGAAEPTCQPVGNSGCEAAQNCSFTLGQGTECVAAGTKPAQSACTDTTDCAPGLTCMPQVGVCAKACAGDQDCDGTAGSCRLLLDASESGIGTVGGCLKSCDVLTQGCPAQQACHLGSCIGVGANLGNGTTCEFFSECAKGLDCLVDLTDDGVTDCSKYCSLSAVNPCGSGRECYALSESFPGINADWGICIPAQ